MIKIWSLLIAIALPAAAADDSLLGIWASEMTFGPALHGELTVAREASGWRAARGALSWKLLTDPRGWSDRI